MAWLRESSNSSEHHQRQLFSRGSWRAQVCKFALSLLARCSPNAPGRPRHCSACVSRAACGSWAFAVTKRQRVPGHLLAQVVATHASGNAPQHGRNRNCSEATSMRRYHPSESGRCTATQVKGQVTGTWIRASHCSSQQPLPFPLSPCCLLPVQVLAACTLEGHGAHARPRRLES